MYHAAVKDLGLANLGLTLYALRQAGASYDLLTGRRDYQGVKDCGGWKTDSSMSRYASPARAQQLAGEMPYHVVKYGIAVRQDLEEILDGLFDLLRARRKITFRQLSHASMAKVESHNAASLRHLQPPAASGA